jgi:Spy/CpxP family protein refolding chaperone
VNKKYLMTAVILVVTAGLAVTVFAQGPGWGHGRHGGWMLHRMSQELNLTDVQQDQIKTILKAEHAKIQPLMQQLRQNRQTQEANLTENFDEAKAQAFAASQSQIMSSLMVERMRTKSQIYAVLTPEQRQKALELKQQGQQRRQQRMQKHQQQQTPPTPQ